MGETRYLSQTEAADVAGVAVSTVRRWINDGTLPARRMPGRTNGKLLIKAADLDRMVGKFPKAAS